MMRIGVPLRRAFQEAAPDKADELYAEYMAFQSQNAGLAREVQGVRNVLSRLAEDGFDLGIVTSKARASANLSLEAVGLGGLIEIDASEEDTTKYKPSPEPLLHALEKLGRSPQDAVYVTDTVTDIEAAHAAGMDAIAVTWGAGLRRELVTAMPVKVVDSPEELAAVLRGA